MKTFLMHPLAGSAFALATVVGLAGCPATVDATSSTTGEHTVAGSVSGVSVAPKEAISYFLPPGESDTSGAYPTSLFVVLIGDAPGQCARTQTQDSKRGQSVLGIAVRTDGTTAPSGTLTIKPIHDRKPTPADLPYVSATLSKLDDACNNTISDADTEAASGTVTIDSFTDGAASGTFAGGKLTGSFGAPRCSGVTTKNLHDGGHASCVP